MKILGKRINVIPLLAKSDAYSDEELVRMKSLVMHDIKREEIEIYDFPYDRDEVEDEVIEENKHLKVVAILFMLTCRKCYHFM